MVRLSSSSAKLGKWCALAVALVTPGSFIVLPLLWLARNWRPVKHLEARLD